MSVELSGSSLEIHVTVPYNTFWSSFSLNIFFDNEYYDDGYCNKVGMVQRLCYKNLMKYFIFGYILRQCVLRKSWHSARFCYTTTVLRSFGTFLLAFIRWYILLLLRKLYYYYYYHCFDYCFYSNDVLPQKSVWIDCE